MDFKDTVANEEFGMDFDQLGQLLVVHIKDILLFITLKELINV